MFSHTHLTVRAVTKSLWSTKGCRCAFGAGLGLLLISQASAAPLTLNTQQNSAEESSFTLDFGVYGGERRALISTTDFDLEIDPATGTAAFLHYYQDVDPLELPGGFSTGNITITIQESLGGVFDRTTGVFTTNDVYAVHFDGDLSAYGIESPFILPGTASGVVGFDSVANGYANMEWAGEGVLESPFRAEEIVFSYTCSVKGLFTSFNESTWIVSSDPPHGLIDARQPVVGLRRVIARKDSTKTGLRSKTIVPRFLPTPVGIDSIAVTMNSPAEIPSLDQFIVEQTSDGVEYVPGPAITAISSVDATTYELRFESPLEPGAWTVVTHVDSDTGFCMGYLPGDTNADQVVDYFDLAYLRDCVFGSETCAPWQSDIDRSGTTDRGDLMRLMDLLDGNMPFSPWLDRSLPQTPCE